MLKLTTNSKPMSSIFIQYSCSKVKEKVQNCVIYFFVVYLFHINIILPKHNFKVHGSMYVHRVWDYPAQTHGYVCLSFYKGFQLQSYHLPV